jgi:hypothetical protein
LLLDQTAQQLPSNRKQQASKQEAPQNKSHSMTQRERTYSHTFEVDETQASGILAKTLQENNVFLSGSSVGKGLLTSAKYYIEKENTEDSFYVVDIGMVVSQGKYSWCRTSI